MARMQRLRAPDSNPFDSFDDLEMPLFRQDGIISRRQALRWLSAAALRHRLGSGGWGVHVEIDGEQHDEAQTRWADMRRQNDLWVAGDRVLRFPAWLVRRRPAEVAAQVRAALVAVGWRRR